MLLCWQSVETLLNKAAVKQDWTLLGHFAAALLLLQVGLQATDTAMCITAASGERNNDLAFAPWMNHLCRCLSTDINVVWCFLTWQEKMKGKNKLVPRLLGITKESVMRVDEKTKDVVQEWPLTTVKRWAASPKSFTLVLCPQLHLVCCYIHF